MSIQGYFQTEKYFKHIEDEIRGDFSFKDDILEPCVEMMSQFDGAPIALHIRRTDYITNPNHTALGLEYYKEALKQLGQPVQGQSTADALTEGTRAAEESDRQLSTEPTDADTLGALAAAPA